MTIQEWQKLRVGDTVMNTALREPFMIISETPTGYIAVRVIVVENAAEWERRL